MLGQLTAFGAEIAMLRNGFSIRFERKEQAGNVTRLYTGSGYLDIASDQISSFEVDDTPVPAPALPETTAQNPAPAPSAIPVAAQLATPSQLKPIAKSAATVVNLDQVVQEASSRNRLDPDFVSSVIKAESNFKTRAVSKKGAQGLMQLMPGTAAQLGVADPFDPKANVEAGTAHLSALLDQYHDDPIKALAAYNAGAHRVKQYHGVPPYRETRIYISQIIRDFNAKKKAQMKTAIGTKTSVAPKAGAAQGKPVSTKSTRKPKPQEASLAKPAGPA